MVVEFFWIADRSCTLRYLASRGRRILSATRIPPGHSGQGLGARARGGKGRARGRPKEAPGRARGSPKEAPGRGLEES